MDWRVEVRDLGGLHWAKSLVERLGSVPLGSRDEVRGWVRETCSRRDEVRVGEGLHWEE